MPCVVGVVAKRSPSSGNLSTADRIGRHLAAAGHSVVAVDATDGAGGGAGALAGPAVAPAALGGVDCAFALHAHYAGRWLADSGVPYVLVCGGTDVYSQEHRDPPGRLSAMRSAAQGAVAVVAFTADMADAAAELFGLERAVVRVVPQSVDPVPPDPAFALGSLAVWGGAPLPRRVFILPAGLRPVKDVLFLADAFERWHAEDPEVALLLVGHEADRAYGEQVRAVVERSTALRLGPALPQPALFAAFGQCVAVVNTSVSEGMCGAIVEAMLYGCPVIARRNAGNAAVVSHGVDSLLFDSPGEFLTLAKGLCASDALRAKLSHAAKHTAETKHSPEAEARCYAGLVEEMLCGGARDTQS